MLHKLPRFKNPSDPTCKGQHTWHFVYFHGRTEDDNAIEQEEKDWDWSAPDMVIADQPMPANPGEYEGELRGRNVIVVIAPRYGRLCGRAAYADDEKALAHCRDVNEWM